MRTSKWMMLATGCMLALSGCDGDSEMTDSGTPMVDSGGGGEDAGGGGEDGGPTSNTIVDVAVGNPDFSTLVAAVIRADLADTLAGAGPFTVFAPTNAAFTASGITDVNAVPVDTLTQILLYHVVPGRVESGDIAAGPVDTAAELTLFLGTTGGVTINGGSGADGANVTAPDVDADNGVIHVIDRVLLPPDVPTLAGYGGLTGLLGAVGAASPLEGGTTVAAALAGDGPFTVFAPTNAAFAALSETPPADTLRDVLLYHVIAGAAVESDAIPARASALLTNAYDDPMTLLFGTTGGATVNGVTISVTDLRATNGIVHLIDAVLLPPTVMDMAAIAGLTSLAGAIDGAADLPDGGGSVEAALRAQAPYTVFAPTNDAFTRAPSGLAADVLRNVLLLHVVAAAAPVLSTEIPGTPVASLLGQDLTFSTAATPPTVTAPGGTTAADDGPADIVMVDIVVTNGVIHVIDEVLLPGT